MNSSVRLPSSKVASTNRSSPAHGLRIVQLSGVRCNFPKDVACLVAAPSQVDLAPEPNAPTPEVPAPQMPQGLMMSYDDEWYEFYMDEMAKLIIGRECGTTRVKIITDGVQDPDVTRCTRRAQDVEVTISFEARHIKENVSVPGTARVRLGRDKEGRDILKILSHKLDADQTAFENANSLKDVKFAVTQTLGSALLMVLNEFLWSVETRSIEMGEEGDVM